MIQSYQSLLNQSPSDLTTYSNTSAFLFETLPNLNWVGFYFVKGRQLILGPFQGKVACEIIPFNQGVCGKAATTQEVIVVDDVHQFEGHIACDAASQSELVIPLFFKDELIGVLDIDSPILSRFDLETQNFCIEIVRILQENLITGNLL